MSETSLEEMKHDYLKADAKIKLEVIEVDLEDIKNQSEVIYIETGSQRAREISFILSELKKNEIQNSAGTVVTGVDPIFTNIQKINQNYKTGTDVGFKMGVSKAKQIVRHENSLTTEPGIQNVLDRILRAMEQIETEPKQVEREANDEEKRPEAVRT